VRESSPAMAAAVAEYLDDLVIEGRAGTAGTYRSQLRVLRDCADPLAALTPQRCRELVRERVRSVSPATARSFANALAALCKWAVARGYLLESPMRDVPRPVEHVPPHRFLTPEQARALWRAATDCPPRYRTENLLMLRLLGQGLRRGELAALRWQDVDGDALRVPRVKRSPARSLPLATIDLALLGELRAARDEAEPRVLPYSASALYYRIRRLGERARVPHMHPHLLRHTWASHWMLEVGDSALLVQLGGWSSDKMVREVYARSAMDRAALRKAREADIPGKLFGG